MIYYIKKYPLLLLLILTGLIAYMLTIIPSGSDYCFQKTCGLFFWGAHGHDAIWHLAIVAVSFKQFPFIAPTFAGAQLSGYNYFLDVIIFLFTRIGIPAIITYFKILPLVWFVLFTGLLIKFGRKLHDSPEFVGLLLFFMYFSGSFSYIITLLKEQTIWGSGALLAMQPLLSLTNVQFAFSLCVLLYILILITENNNNLRSSVLLSVLVALNIALKFYAGVISIFLVGTYFFIQYMSSFRVGVTTGGSPATSSRVRGTSWWDEGVTESTRKLLTQLLFLFTNTTIAILLFYNPFAPTTPGAVLTFKPLATVHQIIEDPGLLYMKDMVNARYFLEQSGKFSPRLVWIELQTLALFIMLNFGTRIIGLLYILKLILKRSLTTNYQLLTTTLIFAMFLNIFFVQKGQWWNTVQFSYYAFFLANIFTALALYEIIKKWKRVGVIIASIAILLTIPSSLDILRTFTQFPAHSYIPREELTALEFLKNQPDGVVFTPLPTKHRVQLPPPVPLSAMQDSAYITAFSGKQMYIGDEVQLQLTGVDYQQRAQMSKDWNCNIPNEVHYLYEVTSHPIDKKLDSCKQKLERIFSNQLVTIYKISQPI